MENKEGKIELNLSGLETSTFSNKGVIDILIEKISGETKIPDNEEIIVTGSKLQFEKFYQMLKGIETLKDRDFNF